MATNNIGDHGWALGGATACTSEGSTNTAAGVCGDKGVTLTLLRAENNPPDADVLADWKARNPCIPVTITQVPFGQLFDEISVLAWSSNGPEVYEYDGPDTQTYATNGILLPLDKYISHWQIFSRVILPNVRTPLAPLSIVTFLFSWNAFLWPLVIHQSPDKRMIQVAIAQSVVPGELPNWGITFAGATVAVVPVLVLYFVLQRHVVEGMATSGLKG